MIKFVVAAFWIVAVAIGSVYYSFGVAQNRPVEAAAPGFLGGLDYVKTEVISVPIVRSGQVSGYFLARLVYTIETEQAKKLVIPAEAVITDEVYSYLYANPQIDFQKRGSIDIDAIRNGILKSVNDRIGAPLIHDVLVEQLDYLTKEEIRANSFRAIASEQRPPARKEADAPEPAKGGH